MNKLNSVAISAALSLAVVVLPVTVNADGHMVQDYVKDSYGNVVKNSFGECWRSSFKESHEKLEDCGYEKKVEPVKAPVAKVMETIYENISIAAALLFGFDSAELTDEAKSVIDDRIEKFNGKAELTQNVSVVGHTDSTGPEAYNQKLSEKRAKSVAAYLEQSKNISDNNIDVEGKGESEPVASNSTREGRAQNRRVTISVEGKIEK